MKMTPPPHSCLRFEPSNRPIDHMDELQEQPDASLALMGFVIVSPRPYLLQTSKSRGKLTAVVSNLFRPGYRRKEQPHGACIKDGHLEVRCIFAADHAETTHFPGGHLRPVSEDDS